MSRELVQQALDALKLGGLIKKTQTIAALEAELAKPEQATVPFPSFMRKRIEEAIDLAINPKGMSVHDGKATVYASDLQRMLLVVDLAAQQLAKPEQASTEPPDYVEPPTSDYHNGWEEGFEAAKNLFKNKNT
jgi:hypothetical protein